MPASRAHLGRGTSSSGFGSNNFLTCNGYFVLLDRQEIDTMASLSVSINYIHPFKVNYT
jgi:hypothetical protein